MTRDDDIFLSAYLDGELDADQHHLVDSALASGTELADRLRAISVVRDFLAGLTREPGADVMAPVMDRIRAQRGARLDVRAPGHRAFRGRRAAAVAGLATVAASIAMMVVAANRGSRERFLPSPAPRAVNVFVAHAKTDSKAAGSRESAGSREGVVREQQLTSSSPGSGSAAAINASHTTGKPAGMTAGIAGDARAVERDVSRALLERPYRRRLFLTRVGEDVKVRQKVVDAVERATRSEFLKFSIAEGIVIDPRHPEQATVYAVLVNASELARLRGELKVALPDLVEEVTTDAAIVTQLADIGRVQSLVPIPLADVSISNEALAIRTRVGGGADPDTTPPLFVGQGGTGRPTAEQFRSARPRPIGLVDRSRPWARLGARRSGGTRRRRAGRNCRGQSCSLAAELRHGTGDRA
jgi:hypothetical protein